MKLLKGCITFIGGIFLMLIGLVFVGGIMNRNNPQSNNSQGGSVINQVFDEEMTIEIAGTPGLKFSGSYMKVSTDGQTEMKSVEGTVPASYRLSGSIGSATFQKQDTTGQLIVRLKKGGKVVVQSDTTAEYGVVSVAK